MKMTRLDVMELFSVFAAQVGIQKTEFFELLSDEEVRTLIYLKYQVNHDVDMWRKFATAKNIVSSPTFFVNDFLLQSADSSWKMEEWGKVIEDILAKQKGPQAM